ncbi:MAG: RsmB/NOP family class I SAM-dependent RNA methyltransferase [Saprospiraceae bacterium]|nr:RsmB/NOP family class I SAM-dependent RNA methyltransferase [Saprospiraceae bacterium]
MPAPEALKIQPLLLRTVVECLYSIFVDGRHADKVIEYALKNNRKAGSRDRAFIAETTYEIVRHYRLYQEILGKKPTSQWDFWQICGIHLVRAKQAPLPSFLEFKNLNFNEIKQKLESFKNVRAVYESIPDWLDTLCQDELPEVWDDTLSALNQPAKVVLRTNRLKIDPQKLAHVLAEEKIDTYPVADSDALVLRKRQNVFQTKAFKAGFFEVQDFSSQLVAPLLAPEPGMRVIDACAGGGGKSLHLAALMQNKGLIIALDTLAWKLDALRVRARRAGVSNIEPRFIESNKTIKRLYGSADRLLLDVPCSGLGVLRRNPDSKWKLTLEQIESLKKTQAEILRAYSPMLKPGGRMVYATCSILPSENRMQVDAFLKSETGSRFKLLYDNRILPQDAGFDGFYMALLECV